MVSFRIFNAPKERKWEEEDHEENLGQGRELCHSGKVDGFHQLIELH